MNISFLHPVKFAFASAIAGLAFYLSCVVFMAIAGNTGTLWLFNALLHGLDIGTIIRNHVPLSQAIAGSFITAILFGGTGWLTAFVYNRLMAKTT